MSPIRSLRMSVLAMAVSSPFLRTPAAAEDIRIPSILAMGLDTATISRQTSNGLQMILVHPPFERTLKKGGEPVRKKTQFATAGVQIGAPVDFVRSVVLDFDRYSEFLPQAKQVKVKGHTGNKFIVDYELALDFFVVNVAVNYTLEYSVLPNGALIWRRIAGDMEEIYGSWEFLPLDASRTVAFHTSWSDNRSRGWIVRKALDAQPSLEEAIGVSAATIMTESMRTRAEKLWAQRQPPAN